MARVWAQTCYTTLAPTSIGCVTLRFVNVDFDLSRFVWGSWNFGNNCWLSFGFDDIPNDLSLLFLSLRLPQRFAQVPLEFTLFSYDKRFCFGAWEICVSAV